MNLRKHAILAALAGISTTTCGCGLLAGFQSISSDTGGSDSTGSSSGADAGTPVAYRCVWAKGFTGGQQGIGGDDQGYGGLAVGADGHVWLTGSFETSLTVDAADTIMSANAAGESSAFLLKFDRETGAVLFKMAYSGTTGAQHGVDIAPQGTGVFLAGDFTGDISFGCPPSSATETASTQNIFLAELDQSGKCVSGAAMYPPNLSRGYPRIAVDGTTMMVAGVESAALLLENAGDKLVESMPAQGTIAQAPGSTLKPNAAASLGGKLFVAGDFTGSATLGNGARQVPSDTKESAFIAAYDPTMLMTPKPFWAYAYGSALDQSAHALASDGKETLFVTGSYQGDIDFDIQHVGATAPPTATTTDVFVAALRANTGAPLWQKGFGSAREDDSRAIAYDPVSHDVLIAGQFAADLKLGAFELKNPEQVYHSFMARLDAATGEPRFAMSLQGSGVHHLRAMAVDKNGSVFVAGLYSSTALELDCLIPSPIPAQNGTKAFVARFDPTRP